MSALQKSISRALKKLDESNVVEINVAVSISSDVSSITQPTTSSTPTVTELAHSSTVQHQPIPMVQAIPRVPTMPKREMMQLSLPSARMLLQYCMIASVRTGRLEAFKEWNMAS